MRFIKAAAWNGVQLPQQVREGVLLFKWPERYVLRQRRSPSDHQRRGVKTSILHSPEVSIHRANTRRCVQGFARNNFNQPEASCVLVCRKPEGCQWLVYAVKDARPLFLACGHGADGCA
ncbi:hypothetical protein HPB50_021128 [Hyalomma asiaticum]|uniref:Uncharacterized protein n=1 Tax=Hyalomma asiaticum TaxID=266040 RepID=A0ACB7TQW0_HYAAI|nr:hypothetical protein HPB50_021128 [Hyalomma asiaticum]